MKQNRRVLQFGMPISFYVKITVTPSEHPIYAMNCQSQNDRNCLDVIKNLAYKLWNSADEIVTNIHQPGVLNKNRTSRTQSWQKLLWLLWLIFIIIFLFEFSLFFFIDVVFSYSLRVTFIDFLLLLPSLGFLSFLLFSPFNHSFFHQVLFFVLPNNLFTFPFARLFSRLFRWTLSLLIQTTV